MLCEKCGKNQADTYLRQEINGKVTEMNLCRSCAKKMQGEFGGLMGGLNLGLDGFLSSMLFNGLPGARQEGPDAAAAPRRACCSMCGIPFDTIARNGKVGCARCYSDFYDRLLPSIQRIHGNISHQGKVPASAGAELRVKREIQRLREELKAAVQEQEFEKAAQLRDRIRQLEKGE